MLDLDNIDISSECTDVNVLVKQYDDSLSRILDKHAPLKRMYVVERPMNDWITDNILALKKIRRKHESIWRRTRLTIHFDLYKESCKAVKQAIIESKAKITQQKISDCNGDQKKVFKIVDPLLGRNKTTVLPEYSDPATLASTINTFLVVFFFEKTTYCCRARRLSVCPSVRLSVCRLWKYFLFAVIRYLASRLISKSA